MKLFAKKVLSVIAAFAVAASMSGIQAFADITDDAAQDGGYGFGGLTGILLDEEGNEVAPQLMPLGAASATGDSTLPSYYNLYDHNRGTSVKNQGTLGTCWAHAALAAVESNMITKGNANTSVDYSEAHLAWFANGAASADVNDPLYNDAGKHFDVYDAYGRGGVIYDSIGALTRWSGAQLEANAPYNIATSYSVPAESQRYASYAHVQNVEIYDPYDAASIKNAIMEHGALGVFYVHDAAYYNSGTYAYNCTKTGTNHVVAIVGWDDNFSKENFNESCRPENNGAWIAKNSWGAGWGDNGFFYISYEDASIHDIASYDVSTTDNYSYLYQYDASVGLEAEGDYVYYRGLKYQSNATNANVYTAKYYDRLSAVGFYTYEADTAYKITVYTDVTDVPTSGTAVYEQSGTMTYAGYHTVELDQTIPLTKGKKFAVAITLYGYNYAFYDNNSTGTGLSYYAATTEPASNTAWTDNHEKYGRSACIKAYTIAESGKPRDITAVAGDGEVYLTWDEVSGATKYAVSVYNSSKGTYTVLTDSLTTTSYTATGLKNSTTYQFLVQSYVNGKWSSFTAADHVQATPVALVKPIVTATEGNRQVTLSWNTISGATKYAVSSYNASTGKYTVLTNSLTTTSYTVTGLTNGVEYYFLVQAYINGVWTSYTTADHVAVIPGRPVNPTATATGGDRKVTLSWKAISGATKYAVSLYNTSTGKYTTYTNSLTATSYTVTGLTNGTEYTFLVQAFANDTWSKADASAHVAATPAETPKPTVTATVSSGKVTLSWGAVSGATKYAVSLYNTATGKYTTYTSALTAKTYTVTGLTDGKKYQFLIQAYKNGSWSRFTEADHIIAVPGIKPYAAAATGDRKVTLSWNPVAGATKYAVSLYNASTGRYTTYTTSLGYTTYTVSGLTNGTEYQFLVQAYVNGRWNTFTTADHVYAVPAAAKPTGISVATGSGKVTLRWNAVSGATKYAVSIYKGTGKSYNTLSTSITGTSYTVTGLTNGAEYQFLVQAYVNNKWNTFTKADHVSATPASKPTGIITKSGDRQVTLTWNEVIGAANYAVSLYNTSTGKYTVLNKTLTAPTYTVTGLNADTTYQFLVQAYVNGKWNTFTTADHVYAAPISTIPENITASSGDGYVVLSWNEVSGATKYAVAVYDASTKKYTVLNSTLTSTYYSVTGLTNGTEYQFLVQAYVNGAWSKFTTADHVYATPVSTEINV